MSYKIGNEGVSEDQREALDRARIEGRPEARLDLLRELLDEPHIRSGRESVDPEWLELCPSVLDENFNPPRRSPLRRFANVARRANDLDRFPRQINPETLRLVFLLGAGASRPAPSNIPTVKELLPDLLSRARRQDREDLTRLADFCDDNNIKHIEDLLTAAQLSGYCSRHPEVLNLVNFLLYGQRSASDSPSRPENQGAPGSSPRNHRGPSENRASVAFLADTLQVLFGLISDRMLRAQPNSAHKALATYAHLHPRSTIITTNYDCCVDRALQESSAPYTYRVAFSNCPGATSPDASVVTLLKLHGSLNWFYCDTCQDVHLVPIERAVESFLGPAEVKIPYPVIGHCDGCKGLRRPLLVPPQALKFDVAPPLNPLMEHAAKAFRSADLIVVVGFSFADADLHITRTLTRAMQENRGSRLLVVDPDGEVVGRIARKLALRVTNFARGRILWLAENCAAALPAFLAGDYYEEGKAEGSAEDLQTEVEDLAAIP